MPCWMCGVLTLTVRSKRKKASCRTTKPFPCPAATTTGRLPHVQSARSSLGTRRMVSSSTRTWSRRSSCTTSANAARGFGSRYVPRPTAVISPLQRMRPMAPCPTCVPKGALTAGHSLPSLMMSSTSWIPLAFGAKEMSAKSCTTPGSPAAIASMMSRSSLRECGPMPWPPTPFRSSSFFASTRAMALVVQIDRKALVTLGQRLGQKFATQRLRGAGTC
mmetsp:Transcript_39302/g.121506  ORF Transcript_39302/g.121506 Transcript_39302/m.121506 type:complete len:219 (-) Transcript_39302:89-745(-)